MSKSKRISNLQKKETIVWTKIFSPPCPNCGSLKTRELGNKAPIAFSGLEFTEFLKRSIERTPMPKVNSWECLECGTKFDEKGHSITWKR